MDDAELVGGVLVDCVDPRASAAHLTQFLMVARLDHAAAIRAGLEPELVEVLRRRFANDRERIPVVCQEAAAWVLGRRSKVSAEPWDLVASLPRADLPEGLHRTTGETLIQLVAQATRTLRLVAPFIDQPGLAFMAEALADATARGVRLEVLLPTRSTRADDALDDLTAAIAEEGRSVNFSVSRLRDDAPWAHLKVLTSDSAAAYIGSANVTGAGIGGRNLELGVLVRGEPVIVVERVLDLYRSS
ncbi:phospholipase D-like domain-containing protein [Streptomyces sp. NPDC050658]|uniref:phospholipase D-like domain-containing protein n=1 Tax=unclassified Streptomyces TaxID=2593676 RepID=UPI00342B3D8F